MVDHGGIYLNLSTVKPRLARENFENDEKRKVWKHSASIDIQAQVRAEEQSYDSCINIIFMHISQKIALASYDATAEQLAKKSMRTYLLRTPLPTRQSRHITASPVRIK